MRHRLSGRHLNRKPAHRQAMLRNMAASLILTVRPDEEAPNKPKVAGRILTTLPKAKEVRPVVEKLVTMARRALQHEAAAAQFSTQAVRNTSEWKAWRTSDRWQQWAKAISPAVTLRRRAFSLLRDKLAVKILFKELAQQFQDRPGGYTRVVRLAGYRLGDAGQKAMIEFVGKHDRKKRASKKGSSMPVAQLPVSEQTVATEPASSSPESSSVPVAENS